MQMQTIYNRIYSEKIEEEKNHLFSCQTTKMGGGGGGGKARTT